MPENSFSSVPVGQDPRPTVTSSSHRCIRASRCQRSQSWRRRSRFKRARHQTAADQRPADQFDRDGIGLAFALFEPHWPVFAAPAAGAPRRSSTDERFDVRRFSCTALEPRPAGTVGQRG